MQVLGVDPSRPHVGRLKQAVELLDAGGVVALPTETFYGLAVDAFNPEALARLNRLKGKADDSPILLLLSAVSQVEEVAAAIPPLFHELAKRYWPGPLTLIVPASDRLPREVGGGRDTVAVRVSGLALPRRLARELGRVITGVSANLHGRPPCRTASEVARLFPDQLEMILDGGPSPGGLSSTILDLTGARPRVVREGLLPTSSLRSFLPELAVAGS